MPPAAGIEGPVSMYSSVLMGPSPPKGLQQFAWLWMIQPDIGEAIRGGAGSVSRGLGPGAVSAGGGRTSWAGGGSVSAGVDPVSWPQAVQKPTAVSKMAIGKLAFTLMLAL